MMTVSGNNILLTGARGFLGQHLYDHLDPHNNIILYQHDVRDTSNIKQQSFANIDIVIHLASPNDYIDLKDNNRTVTSIIDGTLNMLDLARKHKSKFVFASTIAVEFKKDVTYHYANCKLAMENYITSTYDNHTILRIPRVYDRSKTKGLMKQLRLGLVPDVDLDNTVQYLTIESFIEQTINGICNNDRIVKYKNICTAKIKDIKHKYVDKH